MTATWLICIPTVPARAAKLERLLSVLLPQTEAQGGKVKVMGWLNTGAPRLAEIRDAMITYADEQAFEYISFIDDDDLVPTYHVHEVCSAISVRRPDHVGFWVDYTKDGVFQGNVEHSLKYTRWATLVVPGGPNEQYPRGYRLVRDFTHIDPIRTEIARWGRFAAAQPHAPEDRAWCRQLRERLAKHHDSTEVFLDKVMYHYLWAPQESMWDAKHRHRGSASTPRLAISHPNFFWHKESL